MIRGHILHVYVVLALICSLMDFATGRKFPEENYYQDYEGQQDPKINAALRELEHEPQLISNWPKVSTNFGQVSGVALNSKGHLLVFHRASNEWNERSFNNYNVYQGIGERPIPEPTILVYNETGDIIDKWGQNLFHMPHGITVDGDDNVWVTDVALHQIFKFTPNQRNIPAMILGQKFEPGYDDYHFCKPTSVAVHSSGHFFVADGYCNSRIIKFSPDGTKMLEWGKSGGVSPYVLVVPHALALLEDRGEVCVADRERGRVACFKEDSGQFSTAFSNWLIGRRLFSVAYHPMNGGRLYIVNGPALLRVGYVRLPVRGYVIDYTSGKMLQTFAPPDDFSNPHDIAVATDGSVYVAELNPHRVCKFTDATLANETILDVKIDVTRAKPTATVELHVGVTNITTVATNDFMDAVSNAWAIVGAATAALATFTALYLAMARTKMSTRKSISQRRWEYGHGEFKLRRLLEKRGFTRVHSDDSDEEPAPMLPHPPPAV